MSFVYFKENFWNTFPLLYLTQCITQHIKLWYRDNGAEWTPKMHVLCAHKEQSFDMAAANGKKITCFRLRWILQFISRFSCPITFSVATRDYWKTPKENCVHTGDRMQTSVFLLCKSRDFVTANEKNYPKIQHTESGHHICFLYRNRNC